MEIFRGKRGSGKSTHILRRALERSKDREVVILCGTLEMARYFWDQAQWVLIDENQEFVIDSYTKEITIDGRKPIIFTSMGHYLGSKKPNLYKPVIFIDELEMVLNNTLNTEIDTITIATPEEE